MRAISVEVIFNDDDDDNGDNGDDDNDDNGDDDDNDDNGDDDDAVEGFCSGCRARFSTERLLLHWISPHLAHHLIFISSLYFLYLLIIFIFICSSYSILICSCKGSRSNFLIIFYHRFQSIGMGGRPQYLTQRIDIMLSLLLRFAS